MNLRLATAIVLCVAACSAFVYMAGVILGLFRPASFLYQSAAFYWQGAAVSGSLLLIVLVNAGLRIRRDRKRSQPDRFVNE